MMHSKDSYPYYESNTHQFVELETYGSNSQLSVIIALPKSEEDREKGVSMEGLKDGIGKMKSTSLALAIPKMTVKSSVLQLSHFFSPCVGLLKACFAFSEFHFFSKKTGKKVKITKRQTSF